MNNFSLLLKLNINSRINTSALILMAVIFSACFSEINAQVKRDLLAKALKSNPINSWGSIDFSPNYLLGIQDDLNSLPDLAKRNIIEKAEKAKEYSWPSIPVTSYLDFKRTGNRKIMENYHNERIGALKSLVLGELLEGKGRFLDAIINGSWSISEQSTWVLSAHLSAQKAGFGIPDVNEPVIDLAAGEIASLLAYTHYFFKEHFEEVSPLIKDRIVNEIENRIIRPYLARNDFWWLGFKNESFVNNWNPWCNYNVVLSTFLLGDELDDEQIHKVFEKSILSVDKFINYYNEDGACEEGPVYWSHAGGKMLEYLELIHTISNQKIYIGQEEIIKNMGRYIMEVHISEDYYVNFADSSVRANPDSGLVHRYGVYIEDLELMAFASFLHQQSQRNNLFSNGSLDKSIHNIFLNKTISEMPSKILSSGYKWFDGTEIAIGRKNKEFFFAAKGGHNDESHNHNDIGNFILYHNGEPLIVDIGVETYTAKTFSKDRYDIWTMQSDYHNLPMINGYSQGYGKNFRSDKVNFDAKSHILNFSLDISQAYPKDAELNYWNREFYFRSNKQPQLKITDSYDLRVFKAPTKQVFIVATKPHIIKDGVIKLKAYDDRVVNLYYPHQKMKVRWEELSLIDDRLLKSWQQEKLYRIILETKNRKHNEVLEYVIKIEK